MHANIDADRIPYAYGGCKDDAGYPLDWPLVQSRIDSNIGNLLESSGARSHTLFLTSDDKSNFRFACATIREYKGNRPSEKPFWYEQIRRYLMEMGAVVASGMEADDAIGIASMAMDPHEVVNCSADKDIDNIPRLRYDEVHPKKGVYWVSERDSLHNFYCQLLTGDRVDNIPGLYNVGGKSSLLVHLRSLDEERDMYAYVAMIYEKYFGSYWRQFLWENASLLWIKRQAEPKGELEVQERLERLFLEASGLGQDLKIV